MAEQLGRFQMANEETQTNDTVRRRDAERSRGRILAAAETLFADQGPSASINEIAAAAGLNKRMIYHYFSSKEGLWQAVLMHQYEKAAEPELDLPPEADAARIIAHLVERYYRFLAGDRVFVRIMMHENLRGGSTVRRLPVAATKSPILQALRTSLARLERPEQAEPVLEADQLLTDCMALCFFYFSNQATLSATLGKDLGDPARIEERIGHVKRFVAAALSGGFGGPHV